ncbi:MAG: sigma-70 family RNA polymerase sigma factor [Phycisphaerales bacterium]|nr:MAG: sigma-70 family RNA polymerase sigma factor [Phycisphaerales bacterium]
MDETVTDSTETRQLLARLQAGEAEALDELLARHRAYLQQVITLRMDEQMRRRVDASDVVQETQLEAAGRIADYLQRQPMPFRVWLRKTAHERLAKARQRHVVAEKRSVRREAAWPYRSTLQLAQRLLGGGSTPSEQAARRELADRVRRAIGQLEELDRDIILMLDIEGLSSPQAAYVLDLEAATVRRRHTRALLKIHEILRAGGLTESHL